MHINDTHLMFVLTVCAWYDAKAYTIPTVLPSLLGALVMMQTPTNGHNITIMILFCLMAWLSFRPSTPHSNHAIIGSGDLILLPALWFLAQSPCNFARHLWMAATMACISALIAYILTKERATLVPLYPYLAIGLPLTKL